VCTSAVGESMGSSRAIARVLGVDRKNIKKGLERRLQLDADQDVFWVNHKKVFRSSPIAVEMKELIIHWWTTESTMSPHCKESNCSEDLA
jgi:hypothetical protein